MSKGKTPERSKRPGWPKRRIGFTWSAVLLVGIAALYWFPAHATTGITVWPIWIWVVLGLMVTLYTRRFRPALTLAWLVLLCLQGELFPAILRSSTSENSSAFRVVTMNCGGGTSLVAKAIADQGPDLVLLQESPGEQELRKMALEIFGPEGKVLSGPDASILARGTVVPSTITASRGDFVAARWSPNPGRSLNIVSLRLMPSAMRMDFWTSGYWEEFARNSEVRQAECEEIVKELGDFSPELIGGDFNAAPYSVAIRPLIKGRRDGFRDSGVGYGATAVYPAPCIVRIDQLWHSPSIHSVRSWTAATEHSDHKMVVADYQWIDVRD